MRLTNPHVVCYINAAVQLLSEVKTDNWGTETQAGRFMNSIARRKQIPDIITAWTEVNSFVDDDHKFSGQQGDSHEILLEILRCLNNDVLVNSLFALSMINVTQCLSCGNMSENHYLSTQLTVDNQVHSMKDFFSKFFAGEKLSDGYECERCSKDDASVRTTAEICTRIKAWPPYLLIHIMRFDGDLKKTDPFQFPLAFVGQNPADPEYILDGAVLHIGSTRNSGHYVSVGRVNEGLFQYNSDDKESFLVPMIDINGPRFNQQVYILLYRRRTRKN